MTFEQIFDEGSIYDCARLIVTCRFLRLNSEQLWVQINRRPNLFGSFIWASVLYIVFAQEERKLSHYNLEPACWVNDILQFQVPAVGKTTTDKYGTCLDSFILLLVLFLKSHLPKRMPTAQEEIIICPNYLKTKANAEYWQT